MGIPVTASGSATIALSLIALISVACSGGAGSRPAAAAPDVATATPTSITGDQPAPDVDPLATATPNQTSASGPQALPGPTATPTLGLSSDLTHATPTPTRQPIVEPPPACLVQQPELPSDTAVVASAVPQPSTPGETLISIDGRSDDWVGRAVLLEDATGDAVRNFVDFTTGYAFTNDDALYVLVEVANPEAAYEGFELLVSAGSKRYELGWARNGSAFITDTTSGEVQIGSSKYSTFAYGSAFEARVDLRDVPGGIDAHVTSLAVTACCDPEDWWGRSDYWVPSKPTPKVAENDPAWRLAPAGSATERERLLAYPESSAISVDLDANAGLATVTGLAGAVPGDSAILVSTLEFGDFTVIASRPDGSFDAVVPSRPGAHIMIKQDTTRSFLRPGDGANVANEKHLVSPGVLIRVPSVRGTGDDVPFAAAARMTWGFEGLPWTIEGSYSCDVLYPGNEFSVKGIVRILGPVSISPVGSWLNFTPALFADGSGLQVGRTSDFVTPFLTPTGLPVERELADAALGGRSLGETELAWSHDGERWIAEFEAALNIPADFRQGTYEIAAGLINIQAEEFVTDRTLLFSAAGIYCCQASLGVFTVGDPQPMRLAATLLADELSEGSRGGVLAREDVDVFNVSSRTATRHDPVIPRLDPYGDRWTYQLGPYLPMLGVVDRLAPRVPAITLDLPDSELTITVRHPDDMTTVLGPAPLARWASKSPQTPWQTDVSNGGSNLGEMPQLLGVGDTFAFRFPTDGHYVVELEGYVADHVGRRYVLDGTYDVAVANVLDIETAMLPGTPFEVGNSIAPTVAIMPGVPADVVYEITHVGSDGTLATKTFIGKANAYGWWDGDGETYTFASDGEYRVDVNVEHTMGDGTMWIGRMTFGSVVQTPNAGMAAHGRRGPDAEPGVSKAWGFDDDFELESTGHMNFPYFAGDVIWGMKPVRDGFQSGDSVIMLTSVQPLGAKSPLLARVEAAARNFGGVVNDPLDEMLRAGQQPLITAPDSEDGSRGAHPDDISLWAYSYTSAQRPGVRVRETIRGDDSDVIYWRFDDAYHLQSGNGQEGDLPGDFKFQYVGAVVRDDAAGEGIYAGYASGWVHLPYNDPHGGRVMPPFQGAAGGPDGGPLFTVHGREIDIFFMPLGIRPGTVIEQGETFRMAGPLMPTLPSLVEYTVTAPDGTVRTLGGRANSTGYFYDAADDFVLDQAGAWSVSLAVTHDGMTSAGPVEVPYPTGGLLTPDGATFAFFVVGGESAAIDVTSSLANVSPDDRYSKVDALRYDAVMPAGWQGTEVRVVVTMPGIVLVDQVAPVAGGRATWQTTPKALNDIASNFDYEVNLGDTLTVTFFAEGANSAGTVVSHGAWVPLP